LYLSKKPEKIKEKEQFAKDSSPNQTCNKRNRKEMWKDEGITSTKGGGLMSMGMHACGRYTWAWCQSGKHGMVTGHGELMSMGMDMSMSMSIGMGGGRLPGKVERLEEGRELARR
jgi:hypothetical protein